MHWLQLLQQHQQVLAVSNCLQQLQEVVAPGCQALLL
jgi:hypothetical protein